jgi:hypothetical protein
MQTYLMAIATQKIGTARIKPASRLHVGNAHPDKPKSSRSEAARAHALRILMQEQISAGTFDVGAFCKKYGLKRDQISRMTSYAPRTVAAWAKGNPIKGAAIQKITELRRLTAALEQLVKAEFVGPWFQTPNPSFEGSTPAQLVERGESDRLWRMIHLLESGQPG